MPFALEFRHESWFVSEVYKLLTEYNAAIVINDSPGKWPSVRMLTGDTMYIRLHGNKILYKSSYSDNELHEWAEYIKSQPHVRNVYVYFNNTIGAAAVLNAKKLQALLKTS